MYMRSAAISIPRYNTNINILGTNTLVSSCPAKSVLYGSPYELYMPLQHEPMPSSCPDNVSITSMMKHMSPYLSSDSDKEDEVIFDGTFDPNNPIVAEIFLAVVKDLLAKNE